MTLEQNDLEVLQAEIDTVLETGDEAKAPTLQGILDLVAQQEETVRQNVSGLNESARVIEARLLCLGQIAAELRDQANGLFAAGAPGWKEEQRFKKEVGKMEHSAKVRAQGDSPKTGSWVAGSLGQKRKK